MIDVQYTIKQGDTFNLIKSLDDNSVDLVVTSPPYNVGKIYEKKVDLHNYLTPYKAFAKDLYNKLSPHGSICWEVGTTFKTVRYTL